ncbi:hypothetical protein A6770_08585 [Nostoc minutum NIES-26]|uniref:Uncharacterized protein n=1 Tax=Nostoc minutum NIES-26 TaxID=1844469 RepID=A0A367S0H5_9NOSO|nr:hypothetical protein [Dendronalium sp. ChiSLP03b]MDZ8207418.1 hypothetical protein [Dendronalium sp. ChiSLP03b]RCJ42255.1 hypothetical protein A6770_08585 [Nostoc minutum NIES-26]
MTKSVTHLLSSIVSFSVISQIAKKIRIFPLMVLIFSTMPIWLVAETIAPQIVRAYTARVDLTIDRLPDENYETILRRAEATARAAAQRSFDQDILVTDASVIVSVQNYGAIAPVLALEVSRQQWRTRPDAQRWATYFKTARSLLMFDIVQPNQAAIAIPAPPQPANSVPVNEPAKAPSPANQPAKAPSPANQPAK